MAPEPIPDRLAALRARLEARAAGAWRLDGDRLILVAFDPAPSLTRGVAESFAAATHSVDLAQLTLGIVRATLDRRPAVSIAADLSPKAGSGRWLRALGAERSVAVPIEAPNGTIALVVSLALGLEPDAVVVARAITDAFADRPATIGRSPGRPDRD